MPVVRPTDLDLVRAAGRWSADPLRPAGLASAPAARCGWSGCCPVRARRTCTRTARRSSTSLSGSARLGGRHVQPVGPGDLVLVPTGVPHATVAHGRRGLVLVCFFPHPDLAANTEELAGPERS